MEQIKDLPATFDLMPDIVTNVMREIKRLWNQMPAEKRAKAEMFLEYEKCISISHLTAMVEVIGQEALNIQDALKAMKIDAHEWKVFDKGTRNQSKNK